MPGNSGKPVASAWQRPGKTTHHHGPDLKLHASTQTSLYTFTAYGEGWVAVNGQRHERSLVVQPENLVPDWPPARFEDLLPEHMAALAGLGADIILLGTGDKLRFPHPSVLRALTEARIGVEVMDVRAACRTYNILLAEERKVAAALLLG